MAPPLGIIITLSILVAASIAAYENPHVRAWIDRTRHKMAMGLHALGDDIHPKRPRSLRSSTDISMSEDKGDAAETRRQQARAEIMARSRILEQKTGRRGSKDTTPSSPSFDTLVDDQGRLKHEAETQKKDPFANTTAIEAAEQVALLRSRHQIPIEVDPHQSVDATISLRQIPAAPLRDPFESRYEQEMRDTWNIPLPDRSSFVPSSHASESLIDLTPTTEDFPDPDFSIPSADASPHPGRSDYFTAAASRSSSHTLSEAEPEFYYAHPSRPMEPIEPRRQRTPAEIDFSVSSAPSLAGSTDHVHVSEADISEDDLLSEPDGIRTPASAWTELGSTVSAEG